MKKVLIITYYWPPGGGSGVQRCLKFAKYLGEYGWEPVILTVKNPDYPLIDKSLEDEVPDFMEVLKVPAWEPYKLYHLVTGGKRKRTNIGFISGRKKISITEKISVWLRGNFFIPDARKFWIKPSVRFLERYLQENKIDCILSSGPPHSAHLIAIAIKQKFQIPWVADFRDPWTGVYYFQSLKLSKTSLRKHRELERKVLSSADAITVVGDTMKSDFQKITGKHIGVIYNGYDIEDFLSRNVIPDEKFSIGYTGMFFRDQNPPELWEALNELVEELDGFRDNLKLKFAGRIDAVVLDSIEKKGLNEFLEHQDYIEHKEITKIQMSSQVLLFCINRVENAEYILTGKVFEYLAARRPILGICPSNSDVAKIIAQTQSGITVDFGQKGILKEVITAYYKKFKKGELKVSSRGIESFSRLQLTGGLASLLHQVT